MYNNLIIDEFDKKKLFATLRGDNRTPKCSSLKGRERPQTHDPRVENQPFYVYK